MALIAAHLNAVWYCLCLPEYLWFCCCCFVVYLKMFLIYPSLVSCWNCFVGVIGGVGKRVSLPLKYADHYHCPVFSATRLWKLRVQTWKWLCNHSEREQPRWAYTTVPLKAISRRATEYIPHGFAGSSMRKVMWPLHKPPLMWALCHRRLTKLRSWVNKEVLGSFIPYPILPPSLINHTVSVDVKHHERKHKDTCQSFTFTLCALYNIEVKLDESAGWNNKLRTI